MRAESIVLVIEIVGGIIQLCAAALALTLIRLSGKRWAWIVLTGALILQTWRRLYSALAGPSASNAHESITAFLVSTLMLLVVIGIRQLFVELSEARSELEHLAQHDSLTDLPNRAAFMNALEREISRATRGAHAVVMFADIDNFKVCNDTRGHAFGDAVLREIADAFRGQIRTPDIVARIGGDEFAVVLDEVDLLEGETAAKRLQDAVRAVGERIGIRLDLSVGLVCVGTTLSAEDVISAADTAMYESKRVSPGQTKIKHGLVNVGSHPGT